MGPDYSDHTITADDLSQVDWDAALRAARNWELPALRYLDDGTPYSRMTTTVEEWKDALRRQDSDGASTDPKLASLITMLDAERVETLRSVFVWDMKALRKLMMGPEGDFYGVFAAEWSARRVGSGVVVQSRVDLRHYVCAMSEPPEFLERLGQTGLLENVPGLR